MKVDISQYITQLKKCNKAAVIIIVLILLCLFMLARVNNRLVVSVNGFHQSAARITIGCGNSGICFDKVPEHFMKVTHTKEGFEWAINPKYIEADSLCYYKINGRNPNLQAIEVDDQITVAISRKERIYVSLAQIEKALAGVKSQYVLLRNVLEKIDLTENRLHSPRLKDRQTLKSFLWRTRSQNLLGTSFGNWNLVILDKRTKLIKKGSVLSYVVRGTTNILTPQNPHDFKIQFFRLADYSYQTNEVDPQSLNIDGVNYQAKAVLIPTEWTAGHVLIKPGEKEGLDVHFPKAITYVEELDTLRAFVNAGSNMLTMTQMDGSFPVSRNLYIPHFSGAVSQYTCNLCIDKDSILLRNGDSMMKVKAGLNLLPSLQNVRLRSAKNEEIFVSTGIINYFFIFSYLWFPLLIFIIIFMAYPWLTDTSDSNLVSNINPHRNKLAFYFRLIATLALAYSVCKTMIAFKLSYTFPYFEKITGIIPISTGLMLLLFFTTSLILNRDFLIAPRRASDNINRKWLAILTSVVGVFLCFWGMRKMDLGFNAPMLSAYLPSDLFSRNLLRWQELSGMNDLHRSVPYSLFFSNVLAIIVLFVVTLPSVCNRKNSFEGLMRKIYELGDRMECMALGSLPHKNSHSLLKGFVYVLVFLVKYALIPLFIVFLVSLLPGNFSTAFITMSVILGMSWTLSNVTFKHGRIVAFSEMLVVVVLFVIAAAVKADMGYMTNFFGMFFAIILFYILLEQSDSETLLLQNDQTDRKWIPRLIIISMILVLLMPVLSSKLLDTENVAYNRAARRFNMYSQFEKYRNSGYRYAVSDTEFMTVMVHYMFNFSGKDPLSNEHHPLHPSVSSGQSPVVLNDVSLQSAFLGSYGFFAYVVYFGLLALLCWLVLAYSFQEQSHVLHPQLRWRILAVFMWGGTTLYLYISYVGQLPFTGRLTPGFGVDSVGEMLETAILLAFMTATAYKITPPKQQLC